MMKKLRVFRPTKTKKPFKHSKTHGWSRYSPCWNTGMDNPLDTNENAAGGRPWERHSFPKQEELCVVSTWVTQCPRCAEDTTPQHQQTHTWAHSSFRMPQLTSPADPEQTPGITWSPLWPPFGFRQHTGKNKRDFKGCLFTATHTGNMDLCWNEKPGEFSQVAWSNARYHPKNEEVLTATLPVGTR